MRLHPLRLKIAPDGGAAGEIVKFWRNLLSPKPAVSCLTVTHNRVELLRRAVHCFRQQTIDNAEIVIVYDEGDLSTARYAKEIEGAAVRPVRVPAGLSLGALRNLAVANAHGRFVAQWDDDDWHAPDRLRLQMRHLKRKGKDACILSRWMLYDETTGQGFLSGRRGLEGTLVARRTALDSYDTTLSRSEDVPVVQALHRRGRVALLDRPDLYVYVFHGRNTFDHAHFQKMFAGSTLLGTAEAELIRAKLSEAGSPVDKPSSAPLRRLQELP